MGGKTGTTTQSVKIPPEVMARYNAVNTRAENVANAPFQPYTGQFVAGLTPTQQAGIAATSEYAQAAQPYYQAATGQLGRAQGQGEQAIQQAFGSLGQGVDVGQQYARQATRGIGSALDYAQPYQQGATQAAFAGATQLTPENINIQGYMNPYTQAVAQTTQQALNQQQQEQMAGQLGNAIRSGAFGGDRAALAAANLGRQQQLGMAQAMAPIYQQGYSQALGAATSMAQANRAALQNLSQQLQGIGQQGYGQQMGAAQQLANLGQQQFAQGLGAASQLGALGQQQYGMGAGTAQQLAALGSGAQQAALQGAQAQLGAGTLEQQTQQADLTARYQQFLQERGYPFQVAQFLANIAMGTGALSGSTTTTTQPMPFFSDRRVKDDVKEIGKTHDGLPIYSYKYKGDDATRIGLMAQDVEKKHPEAVYDMGGVKGVDYKQATEAAERPERYSGGLVPASQGGSVFEPGAYNRGGYAPGGLVDPNDIQAIIAMQEQGFGPFGESGLYGGSQHQAPYMAAKGVVPQGRLHTPKLMTAGAAPRMPDSGAQQALSAFDSAMGMKDRYDKVKEMMAGKKTPQTEVDESRPDLTTKEEVKNLAGPDIKAPSSKEEQGWIDWIREKTGLADGGIVPRHGYATRGSVDPSLPYEEEDKTPYKYFPTEILETEKPELQKPGQPPAPTSQTGVGVGDLAKLAMFFLKDGGVVPRVGYQEGGSPDLDRYLNAIAQIESSGNYEALGPRTKSGDRAYGKYQVMGSNIPSWTEEAVGKRMSPEEFLANKEAQEATARHHFGKALTRYGTPEDAASVWFSGRPMAKAGNAKDILGTTVPSYIAKFRSAADLPSENAVVSQGVVPPRTKSTENDIVATAERDQQGGVKPTTESGEGGFTNGLMNYLKENQAWLSPFGAGIRGMVQSKSPFLGAAVLEGVGSGLEALGGAQEQMARTEQMRASADQTRAETAVKSFHFVPGIGGFMWVIDQQTGRKTLIPYSEFTENQGRYTTAFGNAPTAQEAQTAAREYNVPTGQPSTGEAPPSATPSPTERPEEGAAPRVMNFDDQSVNAAKEAVKATKAAQSSMMPGQADRPIKEGNAYREGVVNLASATRNNFPNTIDYIKNITNAVELDGFDTPGTQAELRGNISKAFATLASAFGSDPNINLGDVNDINKKMQALQTAIMARGGNQESLGALELISDAFVRGDMSKNTMAKLGAISLMLEGRALDRLDHSNKWGKVTNSNYFMAGDDFERVNPTNKFENEVAAVTWMIENAPEETRDLFKYKPEQIDQMFMENFGLPNMSRYFRAR